MKDSKLRLENRIALLESRALKENDRIVKKLRRKLRNLEKEEKEN